MASIRNIKEPNGNVFYPLTHERAVKDSNGVSLESKLAGLESKSYVEAWDGASTPVVANIPAGVTVTYNTTTYTGTLDASASTIGKIYLVKNGSNYDQYITSQNGNTYSWAGIGSTGMDLSDYATDEELGQVEKKVDEIVQMIDGYSKPVPQTVIEGNMKSNGTFTTQYGLSYIIVDVRDLVGYTITVKTTYAAQQYALLSDYNTTSATFASGCSRESGNVTDLQIPGDAKYLYLLTGDYSDPILPSQIATSKDSEGLANLLKGIRKPFLINSKDNQNRWQYEIFLPCYDGENWVHLFFQHVVNNGINADNWRIKTAFLNDGNQDLTRLVGDGEWEMALQLVDRPDFIGGSMHGNEVVKYLTVFVDGVIADTPVVSSGGKKEFDTLTILESTNLYDPNDNSTLVAEHLKKYTFTKDGVNLIQRINWKGDFPLTYSYIAMLPADRTYNGEQITDYWYDDKTFLRYDVSSSGFGDYPTQMKTGVTGQFLCGETSRVSISVELVRMSPKIDEAISFLSDSVYYNKIYFSMCGQSYSVQNGDVWITEVNYKLNKTN